ncbi:hypothetical protein BD779DRAFT_1437974 [Infundibulicybe gibba]|nr:hypothetical protein BD779DRAFT_1437974 [Infundibulicybe gibba]
MASTPQQTPPDPARTSVGHLLSRAYSLPCSTAAQAFTQLVQPTARFQLALDVLLPLLDPNTPTQLAQRILVSFILYSLYAPHPISINPFKSVLFVTFLKEREMAVTVTNEGGVSPNEQLVWVLWKILKGDGGDIGPYSPSTLARSPLPPKLRAANLLLDDEMVQSNIDDTAYLYSQKQDNSHRAPSAPSDSSQHHTVTAEEDRNNENMAHAMKLLLAARDRVLTLSEQRQLGPMIPQLTASQMLTTFDLTPIVSLNPTLAHPLLVGLLTNASPDNRFDPTFLDVLPYLPPSLSTFDLFGRLLRDQTPIIEGRSTVAELIRMEVLGRFLHECINWLDKAEIDEREGKISDDRFSKGVQNLCRFYNSLIKLRLVDTNTDADSAEMAHFSLRHSRFEDANALYRTIAMGKF